MGQRVINLRGTSGSGKSFIGHSFLREFPHEEIYEEGWNKTKPRLVGYRLPGNLVVLGSYKAAGGGMDTFSPHDRTQAIKLVRNHIETGAHIFFEALVISSTVPRYIDMVNELHDGGVMHKDDFVFPFMDTPFDLCIQQIYKRNGGKPIKEENVHAHWKYMRRCKQRLADAGMHVEDIDHTRGYEQVKELLHAGGWNPEAEQATTANAAVGAV